MAVPFPWQKVMAFGFGFMRLSSKDFWSLSLRELHMALEHANPKTTEVLERSWLHETMGKYPDINNHQEL